MAIQGGRHTAVNIYRRLAGQATRRSGTATRASWPPSGGTSAVAELPGRLHLRGTAGWLTWLGVHLVFLVGYRNRVLVLVNWAWNYFTWDRGARVILDDGTLTAERRDPALNWPPAPIQQARSDRTRTRPADRTGSSGARAP